MPVPQLNRHDWMQRWDKQHDYHAIVELHEAALRDAGFREVGVIWQHMGNRVVMGVR